MTIGIELPGGTDIGELSYEGCRDALAQVVAELERGGTTLEQALALWERGEELAQRCEEWLDRARARIAAASGQGEAQGAAGP